MAPPLASHPPTAIPTAAQAYPPSTPYPPLLIPAANPSPHPPPAIPHAHPPAAYYHLPWPRMPILAQPEMCHPPVPPGSLYPEHSAAIARQWAAYQANGPAPAAWVPVHVVRVPAQRRQRVLGLRDQPDIQQWCVPLDCGVSVHGGRGSVVVGEKRGLERLACALPANPIARQETRIAEFYDWVQRCGKARGSGRPQQSTRPAQPISYIPTATSAQKWVHMTQENYKQSCKGPRQKLRPPTELRASLAYRPQVPDEKSRTKDAREVQRPVAKNFMDLPLELREFIYHYIFAGIRWGHAVKKSRRGIRCDSYALAVLRLSKDIRTEAHGYFLERMEWDFIADNRGIDHLEYMATTPETSLRTISRVNLLVEANATRVSGQVGVRLGQALSCISSLRYIRVEMQHSRRSYNVVRDGNEDVQIKLRDGCFERYLIGSLEKHLLDVLPPGWVARKPRGRAPERESIFILRKDPI